jgi:hypothetical protein
MVGLEALKNSGILALNTPSSPQLQKTVVVLGVDQGGTTMLAGVLQALGVFMGERLGPVLEDVSLNQAIKSCDYRRVNEIVKIRNAELLDLGLETTIGNRPQRGLAKMLSPPLYHLYHCDV